MHVTGQGSSKANGYPACLRPAPFSNLNLGQENDQELTAQGGAPHRAEGVSPAEYAQALAGTTTPLLHAAPSELEPGTQ